MCPECVRKITILTDVGILFETLVNENLFRERLTADSDFILTPTSMIPTSELIEAIIIYLLYVDNGLISGASTIKRSFTTEEARKWDEAYYD